MVRFDFSGRSILVTGGTTGIGAAIARAFLDSGADVVVTGTRAGPDDYDEAIPEGARYLQMSLSRSDDGARVAASLERLDVLVNNAGGTSTPEDFSQAVDDNLKGTYLLTQRLEPLLSASDLPGGASVINVASMMAFFGNSLFPGYSAAKGGLLLLTKSLAQAWGARPIRVNAIAPGPVRTRMTMRFADDPTWGPATATRMALGRWGQPEDVAAPVLFLASPAASFITGECLTVSGGYMIAEA